MNRKHLLSRWVCDWCSSVMEPEECRFVNWDSEDGSYEWLLCQDCLEDYQDENEIVPVNKIGPVD